MVAVFYFYFQNYLYDCSSSVSAPGTSEETFLCASCNFIFPVPSVACENWIPSYKHTVVTLQLYLNVHHICDKVCKVISFYTFILHLVCICSSFAESTLYFKCLTTVCGKDLILFFFLFPSICV